MSHPKNTGEIYEYLMVDGTYMRGCCLLIAFNGSLRTGWY